MNIDGYTYLFYDKCAGNNHGYNNVLTKNITIDYLFNSNINYLENKDALDTFNNINENKLFIIPNDLDLSVYNIYYFNYNNSDNINIKIIIISINNNIFYNNVVNNKINNEDFLVKTCKFHNRYENTLSNMNEDNILNNIDDITTTALMINSDITDKIIELPNYISLKMWKFQKQTVNWMVNKELYKEFIYPQFSTIINDKDLLVGNILFESEKFILSSNKQKIIFKGGALIDEVGLGKTFQMLSLSLINKLNNISYYQIPNKLSSRATLIICPAHLCKQWSRELIKIIDKKYINNIKIIMLLTKIDYDKYNYLDLLDADFVIMSFSYIMNKCHNVNFDKDSDKTLRYGLIYYENNKIITRLNTMTQNFLENPIKLYEKQTIPHIVNWHRIIIDEFHEIYTVSKYRDISYLIKYLTGTYKWCVSGTPFSGDKHYEYNNCLLNMFDFVTEFSKNFNVTLSFELLKNISLVNYLKHKFFRRNTKQNIKDEYSLQPLKEQILWMKFTQSERMIYNTFLLNSDKFDKLIRQLCCHPSIVDEIKNKININDSKTPDEMNQIIMSYYKNKLKISEKIVKFAEYKVKQIIRKIKLANYKHIFRILKKAHYNPIIDIEPEIYDINFENKRNIINIDEESNLDIDQKLYLDNEQKIDLDYNNNTNYEQKNIDDNNYKYIFIDDIELEYIEDYICIKDDNMSNINNILNTIGGYSKLIYITLLENNKYNLELKLTEAKQKYNSIKSTHDFFNIVMDKIKNTNNTEEKETCSICLGDILGDDLGLTRCGHIYCYNCISEYIKQQQKCPMCVKPTTLNDIFKISYEVKQDKIIQTPDVKNKITIINAVGTKLANLILYLKSLKDKDKCIVFSQWNDLLLKVGKTLDLFNIKNVFCRGNIWVRDKAIREFRDNDEIKVIMLSSESAASGTNLTEASTVILLDPIYGTFEHRTNMEWQAIGRAYRMGQTKQVTVVRMIIKDTVEEEIYNLNIEENKKYDLDKINILEFEADNIIDNKENNDNDDN